MMETSELAFDRLKFSVAYCSGERPFPPSLRRLCRIRKGTVFDLTDKEALDCTIEFSGPCDLCVSTATRTIFADVEGGSIISSVGRRAWVFESGPLKDVVGGLETMIEGMLKLRAQGHPAEFSWNELCLTAEERKSLRTTLLYFRFKGDDRGEFTTQPNALLHIPTTNAHEIRGWSLTHYATDAERLTWVESICQTLTLSIHSAT